MTDLISRKDAIKALNEDVKWLEEEGYYGVSFCEMRNRVLEWLNKLPSAQPEWIPVTDRLPEVGKKVLVFAYGNDTLTARMQKQTENGYPVFECNGIFLEMAKLGRITHWMPLPEPPKAQKDGE